MSLMINNHVLGTDEEGYLLDPGDWNREVAEAIAREEQLELNEARWTIVQYVRDYFERYQTVPEARTLLKALANEYGKEYGTRRYIYQLFPYGYGQQACKIAGMRKPRKLMLDV